MRLDIGPTASAQMTCTMHSITLWRLGKTVYDFSRSCTARLLAW